MCGRFARFHDATQIAQALNRAEAGGAPGRYYWIHTTDPSTQAFTDLLHSRVSRPRGARRRRTVARNV